MDYNISLEFDNPGGFEDYGLLNYSVIDEPRGIHNKTRFDVSFHSSLLGKDRVPGYENDTGLWNNNGLNNFGLDSSTTTSCLSIDNNTCNGTYVNSSDTFPSPRVGLYPLWQVIFLAILAASTSFVTIIGNLVVVLSFILERTIRQPTNYFIASLAVSDLLLGSISMPFYTVYLLAGKYWPLGEVLCDLWLSVDYTVCLTSIYTVFCITIDRFCMVKIPAKYRNWRTERKVLVIISFTWLIPILVFFTSIFGWQYFVGNRTVPQGMCYIQYMEDALFNCILQVGYFWTTLTVMCVLYTGIYKVALDLQKKSEAKHKKMTSLVSMAGQTMTKIGIGMSQQHQKVDGKKLFSEHNDSHTENITYQENSIFASHQHGTLTTSFSTGKHCEHEEERSSSPAFPSDTEPSSQSPKRSPKAKREHKPKKIKQKKKASSVLDVPKIAAPPYGKRTKNNRNKSGCKVNPNAKSSIVKPSKQARDTNFQPRMGACQAMPQVELVQPKLNGGNKEATSPVYDNPTLVNDESPTPGYRKSGNTGKDMCASAASTAISAPPDQLAGVRYIDQESLKSLQSVDNIKLLVDPPKLNLPTEINEEPESPVWIKRLSLNIKEFDKYCDPDNLDTTEQSASDEMARTKYDTRRSDDIKNTKMGALAPDSGLDVGSAVIGKDKNVETLSLSKMQVIMAQTNRKAVPKFAKIEDIRSPNVKENESRSNGKKEKRSGMHVTNLVKSVRRSKKNKKEKSQKSRTENRARKALRTITIILGAFVLCWTPWHILSMIMGFCGLDKCFEPMLYDISYWLCYLNSPINPLCYAFANQQFKKTFIRIMRLDWHKT